MLGKELFEEFEACYTKPHNRGIRINTLKLALEDAGTFGFCLSPVPFADEGFYITNPGCKTGQGPFHHAGAFYSQEPSAMSAVTVLDPQKGERILDMCAAPGGKSSQIASRLAGTGLIWSNEVVKKRAQVLLSNIERMGVRNAVVSSAHPDALAQKLEGFFDRVLVDAPCSGEGMFRRDEAAIKEWSCEHVETCSRRQLAILESAKHCLKEGGVLVYSTCTFSPQENEGVVEQFLQNNPDFIPDTISFNFGRECGPGMCRIYPMDGGEGHFVARMRRLSPCRTCSALPQKFNKEEKIGLFEECFFSHPYGRKAIINDSIFILPEELPDTTGLYILRAGVLLGTIKKNRVEPEHAAFMAARPEECRRIVDFTPDDPRLAAFLHGEEISVQGMEAGWTAVSVSGVLTGFGKSSGGVLKNRYPKGLRNK